MFCFFTFHTFVYTYFSRVLFKIWRRKLSVNKVQIDPKIFGQKCFFFGFFFFISDFNKTICQLFMISKKSNKIAKIVLLIFWAKLIFVPFFSAEFYSVNDVITNSRPKTRNSRNWRIFLVNFLKGPSFFQKKSSYSFSRFSRQIHSEFSTSLPYLKIRIFQSQFKSQFSKT